MAKITFMTASAPGHVLPLFGVASELVRRGHQVSFVATERHAESVAATGAEFVPYTSLAEGRKIPDVTTNAGAAQAMSLILEETKAVLPTVTDLPRADLVVCGCALATLWAPVQATRWGVPWVEIWPMVANNKHWSVLRDYLKLRITPSLLWRTARLFTYLRRLGVRGGQSFIYGEQAALRISTIPKAFQFRAELFDNWVFAGPELADRDALGRWDPEYDRPLLLVTTGTVGTAYPHQDAFYRTVIDSAAGRDWHVLIANPELDPATLGPLPPNVEIHAHVPQLAVLRKASAFVTHGGMGSMAEALYHQVPMVAIPQTTSARPYTDRLVELGLGRQLDLREVTADSLWSAVEDVVADPAVRERLAWMRGEIDAAGGGAAAADAIEKLLADLG